VPRKLLRTAEIAPIGVNKPIKDHVRNAVEIVCHVEEHLRGKVQGLALIPLTNPPIKAEMRKECDGS
jgi:hypothetical protein